MTRRETFPAVTDFDREMADRGMVHFRGVLDAAHLATLRADCESVYARRRAVQVKNGVADGMEGAAHHVLGDDTSFDALIADPPLWDFIGRYFGGKFILLNFGATLHPPGGSAYTLKPHRDVRAWTRDYHLSLNMLIMLDDFTAENGATLFLPGSHKTESTRRRRRSWRARSRSQAMRGTSFCSTAWWCTPRRRTAAPPSAEP